MKFLADMGISPKTVEYLQEVLEHFSESLERGAIVSVADGQIRVRQLPIQRS
jgi:hypothetical protein